MEDMEIEVENILSIGVDIPQDIIQDILFRLPIKSLARFRCVSKPWLFYLSSYKFSKAHLKYSRNANKFVIFGSKDRPMDLYTCPIQSISEGSNLGVDQIYPLTNDNILTNRIRSNNCPFVGAYYGIRLVGSCNGLVCVHLLENIILLWNPTTRETKRLPYSGTNPMHCYFSFAFGYDELHDDYKVVELSWLDPQAVGLIGIEVKVYSLRTNSWKILSNWPGGYIFDGYIFDGMGMFLNGAVHWGEYDTRDERAVVSLDLATDTFSEFTLPNLDDDHVAVVEELILDDVVVPVEVGILEGRLALYCRHNTHMDVWVMKEYGASESWAKEVRIPFLVDLRDHYQSTKLRPLFFPVDGKVLINYGTSLRIYDLNNPQPHQFSSTFSVETTTYFESLISPSHINGERKSCSGAIWNVV